LLVESPLTYELNYTWPRTLEYFKPKSRFKLSRYLGWEVGNENELLLYKATLPVVF